MSVRVDRRTFTSALSVALALASLPIPLRRAFAQTSPGQTLRALQTEAVAFGLPAPSTTEGPASDEFNDVMPNAVDLIGQLEERIAAGTVSDPEGARQLADRASALLQAITAAEKSPRSPVETTEVRAPELDKIKDDYIQLFDTCEVRPEWANQVAWHVATLSKPSARAVYEIIAPKVQVPWWFIGIIHGLEASFNFNCHLHNGDSLAAKTVNEPRGRLVGSSPPYKFEDSAIDALTYDNFVGKPDWSLPAVLYRWEAYNGWGTRILHGINTPYLWSFSKHYSKGKYTTDRGYSDSAVSKQCGAAVMLSELVKAGIIPRPESTFVPPAPAPQPPAADANLPVPPANTGTTTGSSPAP